MNTRNYIRWFALPWILVALSAGPLWAVGESDAYADALKAHPSLRAHWKFDGNLDAAAGKAPAKSSGSVSYAEGVLGKALKEGSTVFVPKADWLMGKKGSRVTLELFFKVVSAPSGNKDVVLIGQTTGQKVRYLVGVQNDLSALLYRGGQNQSVLTTINLPTDQSIEVGRWYHLAITSYDLDLRAYIDGYECALTGGAFEFTRNGPKNSTMTFGTTPFKEWGTGAVLLDEVACYGEGLTQAQIQEHIMAAGLEKQLAATGEIVAKVAAKRDAIRAGKQTASLKESALTAPGQTRVYEGENLEAIAFQVGGIGSGSIQFNGKAEPAIWQMGNGKIDPKAIELYRVLGEWLKENGESIYDTRPNPLGKRPQWGDISTSKDGKTLYLHILKWPTSGSITVDGLDSVATSASILANGEKTEFAQQGNSLIITLPAEPLNKYDTVVKVSL